MRRSSSLDCPDGYDCWDDGELDLGLTPGPILESGFCARPK
ncbi:hypothetical protein PPSIR1_37199 [Plesiocystis pacifica SIR-1]|uniref:Uncharacterized protein n=1 Tax=Plesiocystis pacifica SIR-1 TaxID=391625 RepID=A6G0K5_9BACT|nr:hypothetical protein PPSIR1_37199 [Plesiocystis pacifica SIR-1]